MALSRRVVLPLTIAALLAGLAIFAIEQKLKLPKPQIASAVGQAAPDFTLQDQDGDPFHLADLRGSRVVLIFYRGYW